MPVTRNRGGVQGIAPQCAHPQEAAWEMGPQGPQSDGEARSPSPSYFPSPQRAEASIAEPRYGAQRAKQR